ESISSEKPLDLSHRLIDGVANLGRERRVSQPVRASRDAGSAWIQSALPRSNLGVAAALTASVRCRTVLEVSSKLFLVVIEYEKNVREIRSVDHPTKVAV